MFRQTMAKGNDMSLRELRQVIEPQRAQIMAEFRNFFGVATKEGALQRLQGTRRLLEEVRLELERIFQRRGCDLARL